MSSYRVKIRYVSDKEPARFNEVSSYDLRETVLILIQRSGNHLAANSTVTAIPWRNIISAEITS